MKIVHQTERPHWLQPMEPDHASEVVVNLIRRQVAFVCEIDAAKIKDMVCVALRAELVRQDTHDYGELVAKQFADAAQFAVNCVRDEISFGVVPMTFADHVEWRFTAEKPKRRGISR